MGKLILILGIIGVSLIGFAETNSNKEIQPPPLPDGSMPPKMVLVYQQEVKWEL